MIPDSLLTLIKMNNELGLPMPLEFLNETFKDVRGNMGEGEEREKNKRVQMELIKAITIAHMKGKHDL